MARRSTQPEPVVRKPLLIAGGAIIGVALIGFILMTFVFGGGGGEPTDPAVPGGAAPAPVAQAPAVTPAPTPADITSGGRDPFAPQGLAAITTPPPAAPAAAAPAAPAPSASVLASQQVNPHFTLSVEKVSGSAADVVYDSKPVKGVRAGDKLPDGLVVQKVSGSCVAFSQGGKTFSVCQGQTVKR